MSRPVLVRTPCRVIRRRFVSVYVEKNQFRNGFAAKVSSTTTPTARIAIRSGVRMLPVGTIAARNPPAPATTSSRNTGKTSAFQCVRVLTTTYSSAPNNFAEIAMPPVSQLPGSLVPSRHDPSYLAGPQVRDVPSGQWSWAVGGVDDEPAVVVEVAGLTLQESPVREFHPDRVPQRDRQLAVRRQDRRRIASR